MFVGNPPENRKHAKEHQMRYLRFTSYAVLLIAGITSSAAAQSSDSGTRKHISVPSIEASPADVQSLDGIMKACYETACGPAGQPRQWARDRTLYIPGIRFVTISDDASGSPGSLLIRNLSILPIQGRSRMVSTSVKSPFYLYYVEAIPWAN
jgi:hypothetical protein